MNKKEVLSTIRKRNTASTINLVLIIILPIFGLFSALGIYRIAFHEPVSISLTYFSIILFAISSVLFLCFRKTHREQAKEKSLLDPYVVSYKPLKRQNVESELIRIFDMHKLPNGNYCSFIKRRFDVLYMLYHMPIYDHKEFVKNKAKTTNLARKVVGLKDVMSTAKINRTLRVNILLLDIFNDEALKAASKNASYGMRLAEGVITVYIDLESSQLYIPVLATFESLGGHYTYCVKQLLKMIPGIE